MGVDELEKKLFNPISLRVEEANKRDVNKNFARMHSKDCQQIDVDAGSIVKLTGKKNTVAKVMPQTERVGIIKIDGQTRENASTTIGVNIEVSRAKVADAEWIGFAPLLEPGYQLSQQDKEHLSGMIKDIFIDRSLAVGDRVPTGLSLGLSLYSPHFPLRLEVLRYKPKDVDGVIIKSNTIIELGTEKTLAISPITYEDIGGLKDVITRVREMVELPLKYPILFKRLGVEPPKGVLLYGPPGCGKTLLAKAVANEANVNRFISITGPEIMGKFYGESEQRLRQIFEEAKQNTPAIVFIDEIDSIAPKRSEVPGEVEKRVVAQLLSLMDGLKERGNIVVIGATNIPEVLDPAIRRPGRFDREIEIGMPNEGGRYEILQIHTRNTPLEDVDLMKWAKVTHGYTGADLAALCREAAMKALHRYLPKINLEKESPPPELIEQMRVTGEDFSLAYREIRPTVMREVFIEKPNVRWDDIGGLDGAKQRLKEMIGLPLIQPDVFKRLGVEPPKGVLLYGPPGCGKTLLARAVATESDANFINIKGPEVFSKWVGESEKAIRQIFGRARTAAPAIIFFDEFDSLVPRRGFEYGDSRVTERVISQLLTEMDGLQLLENVVVLSATNRPDLIDPAVLRPGRIDRYVYVPSPDEKTRYNIFNVHTNKMPLRNVDLNKLAQQTGGYSGADISAVCREAAMYAIRRDDKTKYVMREDFENALKEIGPTITPELEDTYKQIGSRLQERIRARDIKTAYT